MSKPEPNRFSWHHKHYCVERRHPETGELDLRGPQPPFITATEDQLIKYYFRNVPGDKPATHEQIGDWYAAHGWFWRPKTW